MRKLSVTLLLISLLALWGCNEDSPLDVNEFEATETMIAAGGSSGPVVGDMHDRTQKSALAAGISNTLVILANFSDTPAGALLTESTADIVDGYMFPTQGDGYSVDELFREMSFGIVGITGQTVGPFEIDRSISDDCDQYAAWGDSAYAEAAAAGIDMSQYDLFVIVYPNGNDCDITNQWGGVAYNGDWNGIFKWQGISNYGHELGHLYGLGHSGTPEGGEYADLSCIMSTSWGFDQWMPLRQVSGIWKQRRGWFDTNEVLTLSEPGTYTVYLAPTEREAALITNPVGQDAIQMLLIDTSSMEVPDPLHYVSFRRAEGAFDTAPLLSSLMGRTYVHNRAGWDANRMAMLEAGDIYETDVVKITAITDGLNDEEWVELLVEIKTSDCDNCFTADATPEFVYTSTQPRYFVEGWSVSVTNDDGGSCGPNTYQLSGHSNHPDVEFWAGGTMSIEPGATVDTPLLLQPIGTLSEGVYPFTVSVEEDGTGCSDVASFNLAWVYDATAPTTPTNCAAIMTLNESAIVSWNAAFDAHAGIDYYEIYCNNVLVGTSNSTSFEHQGVYFNFKYTYEVRAFDKAGHVSGWSNSVTIGCRKCPTPTNL